MTDSRSIKDVLSQDHGYELTQCPRYEDFRGFVKGGKTEGCMTASDAVNFIKGGQLLPCHCVLRKGEAA